MLELNPSCRNFVTSGSFEDNLAFALLIMFLFTQETVHSVHATSNARTLIHLEAPSTLSKVHGVQGGQTQ